MSSYIDCDSYFLVFADCIPTRGAKNSTICDLTRSTVEVFPSSFYPFFEIFKQSTVKEIYIDLELESHIEFTKFLDFLLEKEYGMFVDDLELFPELEKRWESPELINNAIVDVRLRKHDFGVIFDQLNSLGCIYVQLRCFESLYTMQELSDVIKLAENKSIQSIELIIKYHTSFADQDYVDLYNDHVLISSLFVHSAPENKILIADFGYKGEDQVLKQEIHREIHFYTTPITGASHCGIIDAKYFSIGDVQSFMHNISYNSCLNKKISIDEEGLIKNCPSMIHNFGSIDDIILRDVVDAESFRRVWGINKDLINVCQSCEFRAVCTDCRAYIESPDDFLSKPLKCGYNPNDGTWTDWTEGRQHAIAHYGIDI